jgi:two-component system nitrogen regulation response regulator NtrX
MDKGCYPLLSAYGWPGNVRELLNTLERMLIMSDDRVTIDDIPAEINQAAVEMAVNSDEDLTLKEFRHVWERELLINKLKQFQGNITHVAKSLGIDRTYLHKKLAQFGIKRDQRFK